MLTYRNKSYLLTLHMHNFGFWTFLMKSQHVILLCSLYSSLLFFLIERKKSSISEALDETILFSLHFLIVNLDWLRNYLQTCPTGIHGGFANLLIPAAVVLWRLVIMGLEHVRTLFCLLVCAWL